MTKNSVPAVTSVILAYRKNRLNARLIFGVPRAEIRRGWHRKIALFYPGDVFGYERWRGDQYGTQEWQLSVCAAQKTMPLTTISGVMPGADLWLHVRGKTKVKRALACFDALKTDAVALSDQPEYHWRELHNLIHGRCSQAVILDHLRKTKRCSRA